MPTSDSGTATEGMRVARQERRNRKITITTRPMVSMSSNSTSATEARTVVVRSVSTCTCTEAGRLAWSCGSRVLMASTTLMVLALDWRWMLTMMAGVWFIQAASLLFSTPLVTVATSLSSTGAPFR